MITGSFPFSTRFARALAATGRLESQVTALAKGLLAGESALLRFGDATANVHRPVPMLGAGLGALAAPPPTMPPLAAGFAGPDAGRRHLVLQTIPAPAPGTISTAGAGPRQVNQGKTKTAAPPPQPNRAEPVRPAAAPNRRRPHSESKHPVSVPPTPTPNRRATPTALSPNPTKPSINPPPPGGPRKPVIQHQYEFTAFEKMGFVMSGANPPALDFARRTAVALEKLVALNTAPPGGQDTIGQPGLNMN